MVVTINFMENLLLIAAEAESFFIGKYRSYERAWKEELLKILEEAEFWFGPRDRSYELLEPRITERYYASPFILPSRKIRIYLTKEDLQAPYFVTYTLAHEAVHVLSPEWVHGVGTTILEEGLATYFSFKYVKLMHCVQFQTTGDRHYDAAFRAVSRLMTNNELVIKRLRVRQPVISKIDVKLLVEEAGCELELAKFLCRDFQTYRQPPISWSARATQNAQLFVRGAQSLWEQLSSESKA